MISKLRAVFGRFALPFFVLTIFAYIYLPIFILVIFSFNEVDFPYSWVGFSTKWYQELFMSPEIWHVFKNSLIVALCAVILSITMALFLIYYSAQSGLRKLLPIFYTNLLFPEVILAVGLLSLFTFFYIPLGLPSLIAGHTLLGLGYAVPILAVSYSEIDKSLIEASLDLGATINQTFYKVIIPALLPSIIASSLLVFIISFDDFLLAFFCAGPETQTLPLYIFAQIRSGVSPSINALSSILIFLSVFFVVIFFSLRSKIRIF